MSHQLGPSNFFKGKSSASRSMFLCAVEICKSALSDRTLGAMPTYACCKNDRGPLAFLKTNRIIQQSGKIEQISESQRNSAFLVPCS